MRVEFLGTSGFHPTEQRHTACVLLPEIGVAFDCGTGAFRLPKRLETPDLRLFLSHAHLDHVCGLTFLLPPVLDGSISKATLYGSAGTLDTVREHLFYEPLFPVRIPFEFVELTGPVMLPDGGRVTYRTQEHPGGSLGYRIDWPDRSLAYITDTTADGGDPEFLRGIDLLIHECNFRDGQEKIATLTGHSCTSPVCELARDVGAGRLVLVHFDPYAALDDPIDLNRARSIFPKVEVARDLMALEF